MAKNEKNHTNIHEDQNSFRNIIADTVGKVVSDLSALFQQHFPSEFWEELNPAWKHFSDSRAAYCLVSLQLAAMRFQLMWTVEVIQEMGISLLGTPWSPSDSFYTDYLRAIRWCQFSLTVTAEQIMRKIICKHPSDFCMILLQLHSHIFYLIITDVL